MKRFTSTFLVLLLWISSNDSFAGTATGSLTVSANIIQVCSISSITDINFGGYNPASGSPTDAQGSFSLNCLAGTSYDLYITGNRQMSDLSGNLLDYELYTDAGRTNVWPSTAPGSESGITPDAGPITKDVYGRVAASQYRPAGAYSNVVSIVVDF